MKTAEEILSKHTGETGIYLTHGMIRGSDALEAMGEYLQQSYASQPMSAEQNKLPLEWSPVETERKWQEEQMRLIFPNYENDQPDWQRLNFFLNIGIEWKYSEKIPSMSAEQYANSIIPNANANDAPYCTTGERWEDIKDAFLAGQKSNVMSAEQVEGSKCSYNNEQLIEKVQSIVRDLAMSGGKSWSLQVPVNFDKDPDVLISELCKRFKHLLSKQEPSKVSTPLICRQDL